jgi:thioredoxin reductase
MKNEYDVLIAGAGPAGLSAALVLGRTRRRVLIVDSKDYRNARASELHGYLTRDGIVPTELLALGRKEIARYNVDYVSDTLEHISRGAIFRAKLRKRGTVRARLLLIATGVVDRIPAIPGIEEFYGTSVHHCPYCDGWEWRDHPLAIVGRGKAGIALTLKMRSWSRDLVLCTHGPARYSFVELEEFRRHGIPVITSRIDRLEGKAGKLTTIHFRDGHSIARDAIFFTAPQDQRCNIARDLGCELTTQNVIRVTRRQETNIPGVYVAGDAARDVHFAIIAAAEGAKAAVWMDEALGKMDRALGKMDRALGKMDRVKTQRKSTSRRSSSGE